MASPPPETDDFVRIENASSEDLSESIVRVDQPRESGSVDAAVSVAVADQPSGSESQPPPPQRTTLPEELSKSVVALQCDSSAPGGVCHVHIVGTAHVSSESCREVEAVIRYLKPEVVFLELCTGRVAALTPQSLKVPTTGEMIEMWKNNQNLFGILYGWFLAKAASRLEVFPGTEFRVGYEEAIKYGGRVILGDRPLHITLQRTWAMMPLWHKIKLVFSMLFQSIFMPSPEELNKLLKDMDNIDMLTLIIQEMSKEFPTLMQTLVYERDQYMSAMLLGVARESTSVVAIVGKGHLSGIRSHWNQPVAVRDLLEMPLPSSRRTKVVKSLSIAAAGAAIISCIYLLRKR